MIILTTSFTINSPEKKKNQSNPSMLYTSEAIVLKILKYSENSSIIHLFTLKYGHQVVLTSRKSGKSKHTKPPIMPLAILEIESYLSNKKEIQRLKDYAYVSPFQSIPFHPAKNAIALFLSEIYWTCSNKEDTNPTLYDFFKTSISYFDIIEDGIPNFHLKNLIDLSRLLGFSPVNNYSDSRPYFNFHHGSFQVLENSETCNAHVSFYFSELITKSMEHASTLKIEAKSRSAILDDLLVYFKIHMSGFKMPKSIDVFREMM